MEPESESAAVAEPEPQVAVVVAGPAVAQQPTPSRSGLVAVVLGFAAAGLFAVAAILILVGTPADDIALLSLAFVIQASAVAAVCLHYLARPNRDGMVPAVIAAAATVLMIVVAYVATRTLGPGTEYLQVFRIVGTASWLAFGAATLQEAVWFGRPWRSVATMNLDALIYALLAAGIFGSMWPGN